VFGLAWLTAGAIRRLARHSFAGVTLASIGIVALFAVFPSMSISAGLFGLDVLSSATVLDSQWLQAGVLFATGAVGWFIPLTAALVIASGTGLSGRFLLAALAVFLAEFLAAGLGGIETALLMAAFVATYSFVAAFWQIVNGTNRTAGETLDANKQRRGSEPDRIRLVFAGLGAFLHGTLLLLLVRLIDQVALPVSWVSAVIVSSLLLGVWGGSVVFRQREAAGRFRRLIAIVEACCPVAVTVSGALLAVVCFEPLIWMTLRVNASVASVLGSTFAIAGCFSLMVLPVGTGLGGLIAGSKWSWGSERSGGFETLMFLAGLVVARWLAPALGATVSVVLLTVAVLLVVALLREISTSTWRVLYRPQWVACLTLLVVSVGFVDPHRSAVLASRLLYDTGVFMAYQVEERTETLPYLSEARCVAIEETDGGTLTVWKQRASEFEVRQSGVPLGAVSLDTFVTPQRTGQILQTVLPLCLHPDAERVLLLGAGSGAALETSVFFPLHQITCVEADQRLVSTLSNQLLSRMPLNPLADERVSVVTAEPAVAVRSIDQKFDVVLSMSSQPAFSTAAALTSREFLDASSAVLSDDGLFCQPLEIADLGPAAVGSIVQTWRSVFADVSAFEIGPGQLLLVGQQTQNAAERFDGEAFLARLQRPHVGTVLANLGWDWSTMLKVMAYPHEDLVQAFPPSAEPLNEARSMEFSATLPFEVVTWGPKYKHTLARLSDVACTMQFLTGVAGQDPEIKRRLADVEEQSDLIHDKPDHYWAYRGRVKERIKAAPQSELIQVKGEAPYHSLSGPDKRRLEYFEALGAAAQQERPSAASLNAVAEFDAPFDPLISPFLHQEIAELAERDGEQLADIELWHRLHRAFYASPADRSIRNVVRTLELLSERPDLIADAAARGDTLDALLQILHNRWHNRGDISPDSSQVMLNDIELSLSAIDAAFDQLAELSPARQLPADAWPSRQLAIEKSLVRPLRAYRSMLLPRHAMRKSR
jgi:hypothetical protein